MCTFVSNRKQTLLMNGIKVKTILIRVQTGIFSAYIGGSNQQCNLFNKVIYKLVPVIEAKCRFSGSFQNQRSAVPISLSACMIYYQLYGKDENK